jgi:hypothetical protein
MSEYRFGFKSLAWTLIIYLFLRSCFLFPGCWGKVYSAKQQFHRRFRSSWVSCGSNVRYVPDTANQWLRTRTNCRSKSWAVDVLHFITWTLGIHNSAITYGDNRNCFVKTIGRCEFESCLRQRKFRNSRSWFQAKTFHSIINLFSYRYTVWRHNMGRTK